MYSHKALTESLQLEQFLHELVHSQRVQVNGVVAAAIEADVDCETWCNGPRTKEKLSCGTNVAQQSYILSMEYVEHANAVSKATDLNKVLFGHSQNIGARELSKCGGIRRKAMIGEPLRQHRRC